LSFLSKWNGFYKWQSDANFGEVLSVQLGEKLASVGRDGQASILKNYIDLKPDRTIYTIAIVTPSAIDGVYIVNVLTFTPKDYSLLASKRTDDSKPTVTVWKDATYTSIVNAIETNDFTNDQGKVGTPDS
jgi:hypothetical protein